MGGGQANELMRMRQDGLVPTWLGRATSGGAVLPSAYTHFAVLNDYHINTVG